jgi:DNA-binding XRE family transcriptional regulator
MFRRLHEAPRLLDVCKVLYGMHLAQAGRCSPVGELGKNLRAARVRKALSQEELASRSGVQQGEISRIERGKRDPQVSTLIRLAQALEMPPGRLLD